MPQHEYYEYFGPDYTLHVAPSNMENKNSHVLLEEIRSKLLENLSRLQHAPSVQFHERPPDTELPEVLLCNKFFFFPGINSIFHLLYSSKLNSHLIETYSSVLICLTYHSKLLFFVRILHDTAK